MSNELYIESILDDLVRKKIDREAAENMLRKQAVDDVAAEISLHTAAVAALQRHAVLAQVRGIHREYAVAMQTAEVDKPLAPLVRIRSWRIFLRMAAAVLVLFSGWLAFEYAGTSGPGLYRELYQPYYLDTDRGIGEIPTHDMLRRFEEGNYAEVVRIYDKLAVTNNREKFLAAYAMQSMGNFQRSVEPLNQVLAANREKGTGLYGDEAEYYLGLAYLQLGDHAQASKIFESIRKDSNHTFHNKVDGWMMMRLRWLR
jgi:hypothetical protein